MIQLRGLEDEVMSSSLPIDRQFAAAQKALARQNDRLTSLLNRFPELPPSDRAMNTSKPSQNQGTRPRPEGQR